MGEAERDCSLSDLIIDVPISSGESTILGMLRDHTFLTNQVIDIPSLQETCLRQGFTLKEFSHSFVMLLSRRLIEPYGDFRYALSAEGKRMSNESAQT